MLRHVPFRICRIGSSQRYYSRRSRRRFPRSSVDTGEVVVQKMGELVQA
jgi:hypothetical protein